MIQQLKRSLHSVVKWQNLFPISFSNRENAAIKTGITKLRDNCRIFRLFLKLNYFFDNDYLRKANNITLHKMRFRHVRAFSTLNVLRFMTMFWYWMQFLSWISDSNSVESLLFGYFKRISVLGIYWKCLIALQIKFNCFVL